MATIKFLLLLNLCILGPKDWRQNMCCFLIFGGVVLRLGTIFDSRLGTIFVSRSRMLVNIRHQFFTSYVVFGLVPSLRHSFIIGFVLRWICDFLTELTGRILCELVAYVLPVYVIGIAFCGMKVSEHRTELTQP